MDHREIERCLAGLGRLPPGSPEFDALAAALARGGAPAPSVRSRFTERTADPLRDRTLPPARPPGAGLVEAVTRLRDLLTALDPQASRGLARVWAGRRRTWVERVQAASGEVSEGLARLCRERDEMVRHQVALHREQELAAGHRIRLQAEAAALGELTGRVEALCRRAEPARADALWSGPLARLTADRADLLARVGVLEHHELSLAAVLRTGAGILTAVDRADTRAAQALDTALTVSRSGAGERLPALVRAAVNALETAGSAARTL